MSHDPSKLEVEFSTEAAFRSEYMSNIANGGVFIATSDAMEPRTAVVILLDLSFCNQCIELEGEVVHCIPPEMAEAGASPGVAIQFTLPACELRKQFEPFVGVIEGNERLTRSGRRAAPRSLARLHVHLRSQSVGAIDCRSRDISSSGVLLSVSGHEVPVGEKVKLTIHHPQTDESMDVSGIVVRHLATDDGTVTAMGVEFYVPETRQTEITAFIGDVQSAEHSRRLGGINGPIAELGIENLLQMFGSSSPQGTLTVTRSTEEGMIVFEGGQLRGARLGELRGVEALTVMLSWREGGFEFHARVDESDFEGDPVQLSAAILQALCEIDENARDGVEPASADEFPIDLEGDLDLDLDEDDVAVEDMAAQLGVDDVDLIDEAVKTATDGMNSDVDLDSQMRKPAPARKSGGKSTAKSKSTPSAKTSTKASTKAKAKAKPKAKKKAVKRKSKAKSPADRAAIQIEPATTFAVNAAAADAARSELGKTEEAVLDLALVGMSVQRMLGVIPEPEPEVYGALGSLVERGLIRIA